MQNLITVATQVGILFALMGVGALCRRFRLVDEAAVKGIVNILILIVTPCLIVDVFQRPFAAKFGRDVDLSVGLVSGTTLISILTMPPVIALAMELL